MIKHSTEKLSYWRVLIQWDSGWRSNLSRTRMAAERTVVRSLRPSRSHPDAGIGTSMLAVGIVRSEQILGYHLEREPTGESRKWVRWVQGFQEKQLSRWGYHQLTWAPFRRSKCEDGERKRFQNEAGNELLNVILSSQSPRTWTILYQRVEIVGTQRQRGK